MTLHKRANKLVGLDVRGMLEGGKPFAARAAAGARQPRRLRAEARMRASSSSWSASIPMPSAAR